MSDHLTDLLLSGASGRSEGAYNNVDAWAVALRGDDAGSPGGHLVTVHEALHAVLNDTTAYGMALAGYALLSRHAGDEYRQALRRLVDGGREIHEAFATFGSIWLVGGGDLDLLRGYRDYQSWYRNASDLVPHLPDSDRRKELMIEAAVRACMQSDGLAHLLERDLTADAWRGVGRLDRPDERFSLLHARAGEDFWRTAWAECAEALAGSPASAVLQASLDDPALRAETYDGAYSDSWHTCAVLLHDRVRALLAEEGAATLSYDGHRHLISPLIEAVERHAPHTAGLLIPSTDERTVDEEAYEMWRRERLVVRETPRQVRLARLEELTRPEHTRLLSTTGDKTYIFCTVRPAFRLLEQFRFAPADVEVLEALGAAPVVATRSGDAGSGLLDMVLLSDPDQLATLVSATGVYANVSLRCLGDDDWRRRWSPPLLRTRLTALFDLSPFQQLDLWQREGDAVAYAAGGIRDDDRYPADVLAFRVGSGRFPVLLLCSAVTSHVLVRYLRQLPSVGEDAAVLTDDADMIGRTVSHLLAEETSFDLSAYPHPGSMTRKDDG
ncbi:hypothetical protein ACIA8K_23095 [Catenuloplanes sp. NPDC051500]|uniref:hypothetical protein n=1 Tax=Catenuloplanes sp. NPDC051500 TaxID=3363959 RepID=UPI0037BCD5CC